MKIIFMGTPEFAVPSLEALNEKYELVLVVSQPAKPEGRKGVLKNPPVAQRALELNLPLFQPEHIKNEYEYFKNIEADMIVTAAYGQFIPTKILNLYKKCINVHGSLLPHHRGGAPIQRAIINGDGKTGVTIMEMVKKMDAGRMFASKELPILDTDNSSELFKKLSIIGRDLLMDNIEDIYNERNLGVPQNEDDATISPNISPLEEKIDFNMAAKDVFNLIRGLADEPGAYCEAQGQRIKIYKAQIVINNSDAKPGTIINLKKCLIIKCKTDAISVLELQAPGKKRMNVKDFLNGQKLLNLNDIII